ncbi:uncharacterized protein LOC129728887 [Wyeomyia smithii]|uniref:uncharacterized protein LOC129728887 n=1 Tax=Wyeomyia smithii TaxID=174621 RepID=UPI002467C262|nr:uncharacterized protein LOC129728887 [Wyeomyia smithii]
MIHVEFHNGKVRNDFHKARKGKSLFLDEIALDNTTATECGIGLFELVTISVEELKEYLDRTDIQWNLTVVFELIRSWRKQNPSSSSTGLFSPNVLTVLLNATEEGKDILQKSSFGELSEAKQLSLADIIAKYHLAKEKKLRSDDLERYASAITSLFKFERKESYYLPRGGDRRNHGGKIINKIGNLKQKKRKLEEREEEHLKKFQADKQTGCENFVSQQSIEAYGWLALNEAPWSAVIDKWSVSHDYRKKLLGHRKSIIKILKACPHYKSSHGFQLIDIDFRLLALGATDGLNKLFAIRTLLIQYISERAADPSAKTLLDLLRNNNTSEDTKHCAILLALHTVLPPIAAGSRYKPTICEAQEDTVVFAKSPIIVKEKN